MASNDSVTARSFTLFKQNHVQLAERAGVSVGTLDQYFPNKSALLQPALKRPARLEDWRRGG
jgi:hypothetical protein